MQNKSLFICAKESFQIKTHLTVGFDLKPAVSIPIIFLRNFWNAEEKVAEKGRGTKLIPTLGNDQLIVFPSKEGRWSQVYIAPRFTMWQRKSYLHIYFNFVPCALSLLCQLLTGVPCCCCVSGSCQHVACLITEIFTPVFSDMVDSLRNKYHLFMPFHSIIYSRNTFEHFLGSRQHALKVPGLYSAHDCSHGEHISPDHCLRFPKRLSIRWLDSHEPQWILTSPHNSL